MKLSRHEPSLVHSPRRWGAFLGLIAGLSLATLHPAAAALHHKARHAVSQEEADRPPANARPIYESIVIDAATGHVLHQVNADTPAYPASLTKMMTLYMLFDALQKGKVHLDTSLKVSAHATTPGPSKLYVTAGSTITVEQAIYAIVVLSANDVAVVIAENLGGSESRFCQQMTQRARTLGMTRTQFKNPHGLPNKGQISTARDMAILARHLMTDFPDRFAYFSKTDFVYNGARIPGHNHFMENYDGADGIKTGFTGASGFNLAASARHGDHRLITVMFGGATAKIRDEHVAALMDAGFNVLQRQPDAVLAAQNVSPFPAAPEVPPEVVAAAEAASAPATATQVATSAAPADPDQIAATISAGDAEDPAKAVAMAPAPPLEETAALVPAPGSGNLTAKGKAAAARAATLRAKPTPAVATASWGIQIGAFANRTLAEGRAEAAADKLSNTFSDAEARVVPVKVRQKTMYRAQVIGLTRKDTAKACALAIRAKLAPGKCPTVAPDQKSIAMR